MDVREKLVELLNKANSACFGTDCFEGCKFYAENDCLYKLMADVMITHGVTVSEGALPVADAATERSAAVDKIEDQRKPEDFIGNRKPVQKWISVKDKLPSEEEYTATSEDGTEYYARLLIAYKTDIIEYEIGYYDGYKWMTEMPIRIIKDVVAWMPFPNMPQPPKGE